MLLARHAAFPAAKIRGLAGGPRLVAFTSGFFELVYFKTLL